MLSRTGLVDDSITREDGERRRDEQTGGSDRFTKITPRQVPGTRHRGRQKKTPNNGTL